MVGVVVGVMASSLQLVNPMMDKKAMNNKFFFIILINLVTDKFELMLQKCLQCITQISHTVCFQKVFKSKIKFLNKNVFENKKCLTTEGV